MVTRPERQQLVVFQRIATATPSISCRKKATAHGTHGIPRSKAADPRAVDALGWVVGGVWTADASKFVPGMQRIETR